MEKPAGRQPGVSFIFVTVMLAVIGFGVLIPVLPELIVRLRNQGEASRNIGCSKSRLSYLHKVAIEMLKESWRYHSR